MSRILWISQHPPLEIQKRELKNLFGAETEIVHRSWRNAQRIASRFRADNYTDIVCVVPLATLDHICRQGVNPLWAQMSEEPVGGREPDLSLPDGREFWFDSFKRVREVGLEEEPEKAKRNDKQYRILRMTQHRPSQSEIDELKRIFGSEVQVDTDQHEFEDAQEVRERFQASGADELVLVAPYSVYKDLCQEGIEPLRAEYDGTEFRGFYRVTGLKLKLEELN